MKPFLGIDLTENKKNEQINGDEFLVCKPSAAMEDAYNRSSDQAEETVEKSELPLPFRIVQGVCGYGALLIFVGIIRSFAGEDGVTLAQAYENAAWLFWLGGVMVLVWGALKITAVRKEKSVLETEESTYIINKLEGVCDAIYAELSVPPQAVEVDVLSFFYKEKDGNVKVVEKGMQLAPYMNPVFKLFADEENIYLANLDGKYAFARASVVKLRTVKKTISIAEWNKDEAYNKGIYKPYKIVEDQYGCIHCKNYHILEIDHQGQSVGIYIPDYELPAWEAVLMK